MAKIGSRGRARRLFPIYFKGNFGVFSNGIKLIFQNPHLLQNYPFATFTTHFAPEAALIKKQIVR